MSKILISPHNDDETLFAGLTVQREHAQVVIVFDSYVQPMRELRKGNEEESVLCNLENRRNESIQACKALGVDPPIFLGFKDSEEISPSLESRIAEALLKKFKIKDVEAAWCPAEEMKGHDQHNLVSRASRMAYGGKIEDQYTTYVRGQGRTRTNNKITPLPEMVKPKLDALRCYTSQLLMPQLGAWSFFADALTEYYI